MKSTKHIQGAVQRRAPTIQNIAKKYNALCTQMAEMVKHKTAPAGAVVPEQIPQGGLWTLDVDDAIWQDIGLLEELDSIPPLWLRDEKVRGGIRNLLDYDRCLEEEARLLKERKALQESSIEQWDLISIALTSDGVSSKYFHACVLTKSQIILILDIDLQEKRRSSVVCHLSGARTVEVFLAILVSAGAPPRFKCLMLVLWNTTSKWILNAALKTSYLRRKRSLTMRSSTTN